MKRRPGIDPFIGQVGPVRFGTFTDEPAIPAMMRPQAPLPVAPGFGKGGFDEEDWGRRLLQRASHPVSAEPAIPAMMRATNSPDREGLLRAIMQLFGGNQ